LAADGNLVWVSMKDGFVVIDFSDAPHPKRLAEGQLPLWDISEVAFRNNYAYAAGRRKEIPENKAGILRVGLGASGTPVAKQILDLGRAEDYPWIGKPIILGRHLYIGARTGAATTLRVFEISPEEGARQTASLPLEKWEGDYLPSSSIGFDLLIRGGYAYVAGFNSLFTLDLQDPGRPRIVHEQRLDGAISPYLLRRLVSLGDRLYVDGLWPPRLIGFDLRDPGRPVMRSESPIGLLLQGEIAASVDSKVLFRPYMKGVLAFEPPSGWLLHGVRYLKVNPESCPAGCRRTSTVVGKDYFYDLIDEKQVAAYPLKP